MAAICLFFIGITLGVLLPMRWAIVGVLIVTTIVSWLA